MTTLNPIRTADYLREGLSEYLATTFSLAEPTTAKRLKDFLLAGDGGIFYGPYVRTRLPYQPSADWEGVLDFLPDWFVPYRHQEQAFRRLKNFKPTLVVTGTGSGKTESFLYPILDYCRAQRATGVTGIKALILYPMNALANDQERRLAEMLIEFEEYAQVTAGILTGDSTEEGAGGLGRLEVTEDGLISDRPTIRDTPPDILLTNYKMLDHLLIRDEYAPMWEKSATSLRYLALDEFHTYDGAQGTDVALLLRRLGLKLKDSQPDGFLTEEEKGYPLGRVTPVATSATLGSGQEATDAILEFAHTVFGRTLPPEAIVGETMMNLEDWQASVPGIVQREARPTGMPGVEAAKAIVAVARSGSDEEIHQAICEHLLDSPAELEQAIAQASQNELVTAVLEASQSWIRLAGTQEESLLDVLPAQLRRFPDHGALVLIKAVLGEISYLRAGWGAKAGFAGKKFPGVELHLWVREVSRLDRAIGHVHTGDDAAETHEFRFSDDGEAAADEEPWLPACYCRFCGRSGWMTAVSPGGDLFEHASKVIRRQSTAHKELQRPLIDAASEAAEDKLTSASGGARVRWFDPTLPDFLPDKPNDESSHAVPVLTYTEDGIKDKAKTQECPSCGKSDAIRYVGSGIATLLSVGISNLFGMGELDSAEKKTLVFTDSVQDAAHRAGFVQNGARRFALRTRTHTVVAERPGDAGEPVRLADLPDLLVDAALADPYPWRTRFELLPPELAQTARYRGFWHKKTTKKEYDDAEAYAKNRLLFDSAMEFGLRADLPRSLALTGTVTLAVDIPEDTLREAANSALAAIPQSVADSFFGDGSKLAVDYFAWARGIVEQIRVAGGIFHPWLKSYLYDDCNSYLLNRPQARAEGIPAFARGGAPQFPRLGKNLARRKTWDLGYIPADADNGRFSRWTAKSLHVSPRNAARLVSQLLRALADREQLGVIRTQSGGEIFYLSPEQIIASCEDTPEVLECQVCHSQLAVDAAGREVLAGQPCLTFECPGRFTGTAVKPNYYQRMYCAPSPRTVVTHEHTSLLPTEERQEIEDEFKYPIDKQSPDAPNVLMATPTLEMGIDIGALSTVMLSNLPRTVANYVQRVGRAGRLSGNSFILAMARGRGAAAAKLTDPLDTIAGTVRPPAAYLSAREILHRQFIAHLLDMRPLRDSGVQPTDARSVFGRDGVVTLLLMWAEAGLTRELDEFCATVAPHTRGEVLEELRSWVTGGGLAATLEDAQARWKTTRRVLGERLDALDEVFRDLEKRRASAVDDDEVEQDYRTTKAQYWATRKELKRTVEGELWISAMERYGLLPNFTLLDDTVELQLSVSNREFDTTDTSYEPRDYQRGSSSALFEFAPGATFYAQGVQATIDAVDLGAHNSGVREWRLCPQCSYSEPVDVSRPVMACPQCGARAFADAGQKLSVVDMTKVYSSVDRARDGIENFREERNRPVFTQAVSVIRGRVGNDSLTPGEASTSWYLPGTGFGMEYLPLATLRWLNLGIQGEGQKMQIADQNLSVPLFRVCRECGHIDSKAGENNPRDHRAWCGLKHAQEEDTIAFALGRQLETQAILLHIPQLLTAADGTTLPSLKAAILLGFREYLGGDPSHLNVVSARAKSGEQVLDVLVLHDAVPGGTGYLAQFESPEELRALLLKAYQHLASCPCAQEGKRACPKCLLPFAQGAAGGEVSRELAVAALEKILCDNEHPADNTDVAAVSWDGVLEEPPEVSLRSQLEAKFLTQLEEDLHAAQAKVTESVYNRHKNWTISFPRSDIQWKMTEQKNYRNTVADFSFATDVPNMPDIAVYLDGREYHASEEHHRFEGDIDKRNVLHAEGLLPWSMTWQDLDRHRRVLSKENLDPPRWLMSKHRPDVLKKYRPGVARTYNVSSVRLEQLESDPYTLLLAILQQPRENWEAVAQAGLVLATATQRAGKLGRVNVDMRSPSRFALSLDCAPQDATEDEWRDFLALANLAYLSGEGSVDASGPEATAEVDVAHTGEPLTIDTAAGVGAEGATSADVVAPAADDAVELSEEWEEVLGEFEGEDEVVSALTVLARSKAPTPDLIGEEIAGIPTVVGWQGRGLALTYPEDLEEATDQSGSVSMASLTDVTADWVATTFGGHEE